MKNRTRIADDRLRHNPYVGTFLRYHCTSNLHNLQSPARHCGLVGTFRHSPPSQPLFERRGILDVLYGNGENENFQSRLQVITHTTSASNQLRHLTECELSAIPVIVYEHVKSGKKSVSGNPSSLPLNPTKESDSSRGVDERVASETKRRVSLDCCVICFDDFKEGEKLRVLRCGHAYHRKCIDRWLLGTLTLTEANTTQCPLCKRDAIPPGRRSCECCNRRDCRACGIPTWTYAKLGASLLGRG